MLLSHSRSALSVKHLFCNVPFTVTSSNPPPRNSEIANTRSKVCWKKSSFINQMLAVGECPGSCLQKTIPTFYAEWRGLGRKKSGGNMWGSEKFGAGVHVLFNWSSRVITCPEVQFVPPWLRPGREWCSLLPLSGRILSWGYLPDLLQNWPPEFLSKLRKACAVHDVPSGKGRE